MKAKTLTLLSAGVLAGFASSLLLGNDLDKVLQALSDNGPTHYQEPPNYQNGTGYYPYTPPPPQANTPERNQHAYDVGYRVGQDDFNAHFSLHFTRHPDLFDDATRDAFASGYTNGYNIAREASVSRQRQYAKPAVNPQHVKSDQYKSGYSPYAPPPKEAPISVQKQHAFEVGFRAGQDDFHKGVSKHFDRHQALYTPDTHESFAQGYSGGYDAARSRKK